MAIPLHNNNDLNYEQIAEAIIDLGNRMLEEDESADIWEVASGIIQSS